MEFQGLARAPGPPKIPLRPTVIAYILRRTIFLIPLLLGITIITFGVMKLAPGSPTDLVVEMNVKASAQSKQRLRQLYGLDRPWHEQYGRWLWRLARLDFGTSFKDDRPVLKK